MKRLIIIILGIFLFVIMLFLIVFLERIKKTPPTTNIPTGTPLRIPTGSIAKTSPPIPINKSGTQKLLDVMKNRPTPTAPSDRTIRQELVETALANNGILQETNLIKIEYLDSPNTFEVLLKQYPVTQGKEAAYSFFRGEGMTNDGICKLPLSFYLTSEVSQQVKDAGEEFNSYPDICI